MIKIRIKNIKEVQDFLKSKNREILDKANIGVKKAAFFLQSEVKQSISGHRAEPTSVDTGRFLNSVQVTLLGWLTAEIYSDVEYAQVLEYGDSHRKPRRHFNNTEMRNEHKVQQMIQVEVDKAKTT